MLLRQLRYSSSVQLYLVLFVKESKMSSEIAIESTNMIESNLA